MSAGSHPAARVAIVTGASTGIGRAIAQRLAADGCAVVVGCNRDAAGAGTTVRSIIDAGGQAVTWTGDIGLDGAADDLVARAVDAFGGLDVMCAHAGITMWSPILDTPASALDTVIATNIRGTFLTVQAAARRMVQQGRGGRIVLTASVTGMRAIRGASAYGLTRAAVEALTRSLAVELGPHGITANAVIPGPITNDRNLADDPAYAEHWASIVPVGRAGEPTDVAALVAYLASEASGFVNGVSIPVDGGWLVAGRTPDA